MFLQDHGATEKTKTETPQDYKCRQDKMSANRKRDQEKQNKNKTRPHFVQSTATILV